MVVIVDPSLKRIMQLPKTNALLEPDKILFQCSEDPLSICIAFRIVEAGGR